MRRGIIYKVLSKLSKYRSQENLSNSCPTMQDSNSYGSKSQTPLRNRSKAHKCKANSYLFNHNYQHLFHRTTEWSGLMHIQPPAVGKADTHQIRLHRAPSYLALNASRDGASITSLGSLFSQYFVL